MRVVWTGMEARAAAAGVCPSRPRCSWTSLGPGLTPVALAQGADEAQVEAQTLSAADSENVSMGRTLAEWYGMGGWVMHLLLLCSILETFSESAADRVCAST